MSCIIIGVVSFLFGFIMCSAVLYFHLNVMVDSVNELNQKYNTLINIISGWQAQILIKT